MRGELRIEKGGFTIEAVFLLPIVIFIVFAMLFAGFFMQDRVVIQTILAQGAYRGAWVIRQQGEPDSGRVDFAQAASREPYFPAGFFPQAERQVRDYVDRRLDRPFCLARRIEIGVRAGSTGVRVTGRAVLPIPLPGARLYFEGREQMEETAEAALYMPAEFVRRVTALGEIVE